VYERACGVDQVVNQNALLALYVADDVHNLGYVGLRTALVDDGKRHIQLLSKLAGTGNRTQIGRNDNGIIGADAELARNVRDQNGRTEHVIHRNVKEALDLCSVQVHGQHAVSACSSNKVCDQLCGDRVTRLALAVLTSVAEIRDYSRDTACRCTLAGVDHDEQLHQVVVYRTAGGLYEEHVRAANGFRNGNRDFAVSEGGDGSLADRQSERRSDLHRQCGMGVAGENFDVFSVRNH